MRALIVVPARYGSKRLPGKPLAPIAGRTLLARTVDIARAAARARGDVAVVVATDDARIAAHAKELGVASAMTDTDITSGTGRALAAALMQAERPATVVNLQGDAPFTPVTAVTALIDALRGGADDVATPVVPLDWAGLDRMRAAKATTPFSGTTAIVDANGRALWFSKSILPAMREEATMRARGDPCPVLRHVGLYAYRFAAIERFEALGPSRHEALEGLEQLRVIEAGMTIRAIAIRPPTHSMSGIDSPEDIARAEGLIAAHGDPWIGG